MKFLTAILTWLFSVIVSVSIIVLLFDTFLIFKTYAEELRLYIGGSIHVPFLLYYLLAKCHKNRWSLRKRIIIILIFVILSFFINPYAALVLFLPFKTGQFQFYILPLISFLSILFVTTLFYSDKPANT